MHLRVNKRELFRKLGYEPHPVQVLVHRSTAKRRVVACGTRIGKSTCAAMEAVAAILEPCERKLGWLVAPTYGLTEKIFRRVVHALQLHFPLHIREYNPRERRIVVVNFGGGTSELKAMSADRPDSLLGEAIDFLIVDEAASLQDSVWGECLAPRLIDRNGWALLVSTPIGQNWFYQQYKRGQKKRDPDYESWRAPTISNPYVDAMLVEAERARLDPATSKEKYEAEFGGPPEPCDVCGGPSADVTGLMVRFGEQPRYCVECGREVDKNGHTVVTMWNGVEQPVHTLLVDDGTDDDTREVLYRDFGPQKPS